MKQSLPTWIFLAAILVGTYLRAHDLLEPYEDGHRGSCAALFALMAKNHQRFGPTVTGGVGVLNPDRPRSTENFNYYTHHPQGCVLLATLGAVMGGTKGGLRLIFMPFAIGIVLLAYRLARRRGPTTAAAAGALAALTPLAVYYGAFVNFEIPTLFFVLLTLYLVLRYRRRGRRKDLVRALLSYVAAVFCDWIALGLPLCLFVLLPFLSDGATAERRRATTKLVWLLVAGGVFAVVATKLQVFLQVSKYGAAYGASRAYYKAVTPLAEDFLWSDWLDRMSRHASELVGVPMLVLAGLGLLLLVIRFLRGRVDEVDVAAATITTIGLANVTILANHAEKHDFYLLYAMPAFALLAATALFAARGAVSRPLLPRAVATALLLVLLTWQVFQSVELLERRRSFRLSAIGKQVNEATEPQTVVILAVDYFTLQVAVAADRYVDYARDLAALKHVMNVARLFGMQGRKVVVLVPSEQEKPPERDFVAMLEAAGPGRPMGAFTRYDLGPLPETQ